MTYRGSELWIIIDPQQTGICVCMLCKWKAHRLQLNLVISKFTGRFKISSYPKFDLRKFDKCGCKLLLSVLYNTCISIIICTYCVGTCMFNRASSFVRRVNAGRWQGKMKLSNVRPQEIIGIEIKINEFLFMYVF